MAFPTFNTSRECVVCGGEIKKGRRYDTIYCKPACKQKAYTARLKKEKADAAGQ